MQDLTITALRILPWKPFGNCQFTLGSQEVPKRGEKPPMFSPPEHSDLDPPLFFPNSFRDCLETLKGIQGIRPEECEQLTLTRPTPNGIARHPHLPGPEGRNVPGSTAQWTFPRHLLLRSSGCPGDISSRDFRSGKQFTTGSVMYRDLGNLMMSVL